MDIQNELFKHKDIKYKEFQSKLIPTIKKELVIGVRIPTLRKISKEFYKSNQYKDFLNTLPHKYYEENNIHAFLIENINNFDNAITETEKFLAYIDNWATCDSFLPPVFKKNPDKLLPYVLKWIRSEHTYTIRYGIVVLMKLYSDKYFNEEFLKQVAAIKCDEYYVQMAVAWYFAELLAKQYETSITYIESNILDNKTHNKAIRKAIESNKISAKTKLYLKSLKQKS